MSAHSLVFLLPGELQTPTGGYVYDARLIEGLRSSGWQVRIGQLGEGFPAPAPQALQAAQALLAALPDGQRVLIDGLALAALADLLAPQARRLQLYGLLHMPLASAPGLSAPQAQRLALAEVRALGHLRRVIVTGAQVLAQLCAQGIAPERCYLVEPGTDAAAGAPRPEGTTLQLLCVANLVAGKGHAELFEALAGLLALPWHLRCVGSHAREPATSSALQALLPALGLQRRVELTGPVAPDTIGSQYRQADLFVLASRFETYGMAVAEALAHALPVIATRTGAIPSLVGSAAGLLVEPGDVGSLRAALARALSDREARERWRQAALRVGERLPRWPEVSARIAQILQQERR